MAKKKLLVVSVALLLAAVQFTPASSSSSSYWGFNCAGGNFTPRSSYSRNLDAVTAVLPGRAASSSLLFNSSQAAGPRGEATAYGIAQCQQDLDRSLCERCVTRGLMDARRVCGFSDGAFVFGDLCTVGYYTTGLLPWLPHDPSVGRVIRRNDGADVTIIHSKVLEDALHELAMAVANRTTTSPQHFATGQKEVDAEDYQLNLYAAAQCIPSMSALDCDSCLGLLFDILFLSADDLVAGRAATPWCSYRVAPHQFFTSHPTLTLPPARPLGNGSSATAGEKHGHTKHTPTWVWAIGVLGATVLLLVVVIIIGLAYWCRKKRQNNSSGDEHRNEIQCTGKALEFKMCPSAVESFTDIIQQAKTKKISLFLDYDGTLSPIVSDPAMAYMSNEMRAVLQKAAFLFNTSIVSDKVFDFVKIKDINYAGSHGMDIKVASSTTESASASGKEIVEDSYQPAKEHLAVINQVFNTLQTATRDIAGANVEHNVFCVSLHYRNVASEDMPRIQHVVDEVLEEVKDAAMLTFGHMVYEFRPPVDWNKGHAVLYLLRELGLQDSFPIYIGDDVTDEDAFKVLRERNTGVGILVSERISRKTSAFFSLKDPSQVMDFLNLLVSWKLETGNGGQ